MGWEASSVLERLSCLAQSDILRPFLHILELAFAIFLAT
jgi:hypothetical protein